MVLNNEFIQFYQPGPLCELLNEKDDSQGYWDRHLYVAAAEVKIVINYVITDYCLFRIQP